jgi:ribonuclease HII
VEGVVPWGVPVVAAAVILPEKFRHRRPNDSKQLAPELCEKIYSDLVSNPEVRRTVGTARLIVNANHRIV